MKSVLDRGGLFVTLPTAAAVLAVALLYFVPNQKKIEALRSELCSRQNLASCTNSLAVQTQELQKQLAEVRDYVDAWGTRLLAEDEAVQVQAEITRLASTAGVETKQLHPGAEIEMPTLVRLPLKVELRGSFAEIFDFVSRVEQLPRFLWFEHITLSTTGEAGQDVECEVDLTVFLRRSENSG